MISKWILKEKKKKSKEGLYFPLLLTYIVHGTELKKHLLNIQMKNMFHYSHFPACSSVCSYFK